MDTDKIIEDLNRRFAAPLPEFYSRRIIFWYDEEGEFSDQFDSLSLPGVRLVRLTGANSFAVKKLLAVDDPASSFLVYRPFRYDEPDDDWLLDVQLYSEEFRSDLLAIWMDEMQLPATPALRQAVKSYRRFFAARDRRAKVAAISARKEIIRPDALELAVMAVLAGCERTPGPGAIIKAVLAAGVSQSDNPICRALAAYGADAAFWAMVRQCAGYAGQPPQLGGLAAHLLLTAAMRTLHPEHLAGLERFLSAPHEAWCYDFVSGWLHSPDNRVLYELARQAEEELCLPQRFDSLPADEIAGVECFPCINELLLKKLMTNIANQQIDVEAIRTLAEKRRTCAWYELLGNYFDGVLQIAGMQEFYKQHAAGFHAAQPAELWKSYTAELYKMDTFYRLFHLSFARSLQAADPVLDDLFKQDAEVVERLYKHWFLSGLDANWTAVCADELREYGRLPGIAQQTDFYRDRVQTAENRLFVIVSDALRYEVAASLCDQLRLETQAQVELDSVQGVFPTITKFGMAALLPHKALSAELRGDKLVVLADGSPTGSAYRDRLLKAANPASTALQYDAVIKAKRAERSEWVKGKSLVYIYHDAIDKAGHADNADVFPVCDDAIQELKNLIRIIVNDFGATNILVTADHGFLYTYEPLTESDKTDRTSFGGQEAEYGRRYAILRRGASPGHLLPVRFLDGQTGFEAFAPREGIRIRMNGGGMNYVHGGVSLQEMVVPVLRYHYLRNSTREYRQNRAKYDTKPVVVSLLSAGRKVSNMIFSLNFYQKEAVGPNREPASYQLYFVDSAGRQISDVQKIIADKADALPQERTFRRTFNLRSLPYSSTESYYLVIAEQNGLIAPQREEFQIDIAFAVEEFNFF